MEYSEFVNIVKENTQFVINGRQILDAAEKYYSSQNSGKPAKEAISVPAQQGVEEKRKEAFEGLMIDYASEAWKMAANAFRMYPQQKHTFSDVRGYLLEYGRKQFQLDAAQPIQPSLEEKKDDLVVSDINTDVSSVASHSCTVGNSVEQESTGSKIMNDLKESKRMLKERMIAKLPPIEIRKEIEEKVKSTYELNKGNLDKQSFRLGMYEMWNLLRRKNMLNIEQNDERSVATDDAQRTEP
jgi:hypothetical protein